ncbi:sensor histidine kinase [Sediminispirochaeta bajacaliforniensis]|uniref:sensor histidine kinase n=1 Tax=Sediminispirochaeta bajacaliforniensis TaxID=148 RepID=UPI0003731B68|nr:histidine kinase [Sediminispirochaeta bajacaliforniensis]
MKHANNYVDAKISLTSITLIIHIVCIFQYHQTSKFSGMPLFYIQSVLVLLFIDAVIAIINIIKLLTIPNLALFYLRGFIILIISYTIQDDFLLEILLYIDYSIPTRYRNNWKYSIIYLSVYLCLLALLQFPNPLFGTAFLSWDFKVPLFWDYSMFLLLTILFTTCLFLMIYYREQLIRLHRELSLEKSIKSKLLRLNQRFQDYAYTAENNAKRKERRAITQKIHDSTGYSFTNIISLMDVAISLGDEDFDRLTEIHMTAKKEAKNGLKQTRKILTYTRNQEQPNNAEDEASILHLIQTFRKVTDIETHLEIINSKQSYGKVTDAILFSIVREALTNILQHSNADKVFIYFGEVREDILLYIRDNGRNYGETSFGIGLTGVQERVANVGGRVTFQYSIDGFSIKAEIPIHKGGKKYDQGTYS